ncbi:hypothetical protein K2X33_03345, partial [bacterium]|nr:hypothetical protein [bacterium]
MTARRIVISLVLLLTSSLWAAVSRQPHIEAELVAASQTLTQNSPLLVGIRLKVEPDWHIYWRNPGDSGESTTVQWRLPAGFAASPLLWPPPHRIAIPPLVNFGYDGEVLLLTEILVPAHSASTAQSSLHADVAWLVCKDICIPGKATLSLALPWGAAKPSSWAEKLEKARTRTPVASTQAGSRAHTEGHTLHLELTTPTEGIQSANYFPFSETLIDHAADQTPAISSGKIRWAIPLSSFAEPSKLTAADFAGVVVVNGAEERSLEIAPEIGGGASRLLEALLFAFLGGLVLNLMPCVFPVLCLKVLAFA